MSGMSSLLKAFGIDFSPEGIKAMLAEYGVNYDEVITLLPQMAKTLDDFNERLKRVENMQVSILNLLTERNEHDWNRDSAGGSGAIPLYHNGSGNALVDEHTGNPGSVTDNG